MANYIQTEITTSKAQQAELVHFIDTPGLVDGDMKYPFDVNEAILWTANMVDLILVFFDPIGQALCKRTLDVVEALSEKHHPKLRYFLSKADEAGDECDRQRVLMQIVQELCRRPSLNKTCFVNRVQFFLLKTSVRFMLIKKITLKRYADNFYHGKEEVRKYGAKSNQ